MLLQLVSVMVLLAASSAAPVLPGDSQNPQGLPNEECSITNNPSFMDVRTIACLVDKEVYPKMEDMTEPDECDCLPMTKKFKFTSSVNYGVAPHIVIPKPYKSYQPYFYPENTKYLNGTYAPVSTEWIIKDHINSLNGFISYFSSSQMAGNDVKAAVKELETVLPLLNDFEFSSKCPSDERQANFSSVGTASCQLECAKWYFSTTVKGLNFSLANHEIYKNKSSGNSLTIGINKWEAQKCCPILEEVHNLSAQEYRNLTCNTETLQYQAYLLFDDLEPKTTTACDGMSTVTGIKKWTDYYKTGSFPPAESCSFTEQLYVYANHFDALNKHLSDLTLLEDASTTSFLCFSSTAKSRIQFIRKTILDTLPITDEWMKARGCPSCASSCTSSSVTSPTTTPITLHLACSDMYKQVSCLALDLRSIAKSLNMFLDLRKEAEDTWDVECPV